MQQVNSGIQHLAQRLRPCRVAAPRPPTRGWPQHRESAHALQRRIRACSSSEKTEDVVSTSAPLTSQSEAQHARGQALRSQDVQERELAGLAVLPEREARLETLALWVGAAVAFGAGVWYVEGAEKGQEFFAGYLLEQSLSIDNLFVFVLVFNYFKTPVQLQQVVLSWGIATAAVLRLVMILLGTELIQSFRPLLLGFALILLYSAWVLLVGDRDEDEDLSDNAIVKFCSRLLPVSDRYEGSKFFTTGPAAAIGGAATMVATPLLLTLAVVELSDVLFAVDSIPAVFGVTLDPFVIYTSNIFAILSLRSLYAFVASVMTELRFLDKAVALVLGFIGVKMVLEFGGVAIRTDYSLLTVGTVLGAGVAASLLFPEGDDGPGAAE